MFGKGMEMMISSAIKAAGVDPDEVMAKVDAFIGNVSFQLDRFGNRLDEIDARLARLEKAAGILHPSEPVTIEGEQND